MPRMTVANILTLVLVLITLITLDARAASLRSALQDASRLLADGDAPGAIASYREIQVESPDSEEAKFGIGCSQYVQGTGQSAAGALEEAATSFQAAEEVFRRLSTAQDSKIREGAVYNRANTVAQKAKMIPPQEKYKEAVAALGEAVSAYEQVLRDFPEHKGAGQNLDHVRYQLKQLLQNPPESQDEEDPEEEPPQPVSIFTKAETQISGAEAVMHNDGMIVELVSPKTGEAKP